MSVLVTFVSKYQWFLKIKLTIASFWPYNSRNDFSLFLKSYPHPLRWNRRLKGCPLHLEMSGSDWSQSIVVHLSSIVI